MLEKLLFWDSPKKIKKQTQPQETPIRLIDVKITNAQTLRTYNKEKKFGYF